MPHGNSLGVVTGLVLMASVVAMIGSLERVSRALRAPPSSPGPVMHLASYDALPVPAPAAPPSCTVMLPGEAPAYRRN
jgi:hypothetical protein